MEGIFSNMRENELLSSSLKNVNQTGIQKCLLSFCPMEKWVIKHFIQRSKFFQMKSCFYTYIYRGNSEGSIAKQDFSSWGWSSKASCVTRWNNYIFLFWFLLLPYLPAMMQIEIYQWPRSIHVQQWMDYRNIGGENM